jgi:hypothetical protein
MAFELTEIVAELVEGIGFGGQAISLEYGLPELGSAPTGHLGAAMEKDFQEADHAGVMDFDAWELDLTPGDGEGQFLKQREIDMPVEALRLEASEAVCDFQELGAHCGQVIETLFEAEFGQVVGAKFVAQKGGKLLLLFEERVFAVSAEDMMAMLDLLQGGIQFAL